MRFFNTAGPVNCQDHYCLPPLERFDLADIVQLIEQKKYFILYAPRQVGKTTYLLALMDYLNQTDRYRCLYFNVEVAQTAREDVGRGIKAILSELASMARDFLKDPFVEQVAWDVLANRGPDAAFNEVLTRWAEQSHQPLVLLIDEIDALVGDTLISVLRQLRAGYPKRPGLFPQSVILCGVRDVRDYRIYSAQEKAPITGGSAFNIKAESLHLGNFTRPETETLLQQHTAETGQQFESDALALIWQLTQGQPWLVNALAYEACFKMKAGRDRANPITSEMVIEAKEAGPQLLLQTFLQRIVNSGGRIEREYGLGRGRTDLLVIWPYEGGLQQVVIELKLLHHSLERTLGEGLAQTWAYMDRCGTEAGHLVIFDRDKTRPWEEKIFQREEMYQGNKIVVWGM